MTRRIVEAILRLAPASFRDRHGEEFLAVHDQRSATAGRGFGRLLFAVRETVGSLVLVARLRLRGGSGGGAPSSLTTTLGGLGQDVRFALRTLRRNPGFASVAVLVLALGIGANAAIFSAVNAFFFRPLPFPDSGRLVTIFETNPEFGWDDATAAPANMFDWREQVDAFEDVSAYSEFTNQITTFRDGQPALIGGTGVVGNFFQTLRVEPALGRTFRMEETWEGSDNVVVISHDLWVDHFGRDPGIIGRTIEFSNSAPEIIGVMPPGFRFPSEQTQLWYTMGWATGAREEVWFRRAHFVRAFGRLAPGATEEEANAQLQVVVGRLQAEYPETNSVMGAGLMPMRDFLIKDVRTPLLVLLGAVGLLLLLACTNVANLMLVRANERVREVALRHALGAARSRVAQQMLTESTLIAVLGGLVGLGLGWPVSRRSPLPPLWASTAPPTWRWTTGWCSSRSRSQG